LFSLQFTQTDLRKSIDTSETLSHNVKHENRSVDNSIGQRPGPAFHQGQQESREKSKRNRQGTYATPTPVSAI